MLSSNCRICTHRCPRRQSSFTLSDMRTDVETPSHRRAPRPSSAPPSFLLAQRLNSQKRPQSAAAAVKEPRFHRLAQPSVEVPRSNSPARKLMETRGAFAMSPRPVSLVEGQSTGGTIYSMPSPPKDSPRRRLFTAEPPKPEPKILSWRDNRARKALRDKLLVEGAMIAEECSANAHAAVSAAQVTAMQQYTQLLEREARTYEELTQMPGSVKFAPSTPVRSKPRDLVRGDGDDRDEDESVTIAAVRGYIARVSECVRVASAIYFDMRAPSRCTGRT